jgi:alpha-D-xyloside xylohydrolase
MKALLVFLTIWITIPVLGQSYQSHTLKSDRLSVQLSAGVLDITPLTEKTVRVQWHKGALNEKQELVLVNKVPVPNFKVSVTPTIQVATPSRVLT